MGLDFVAQPEITTGTRPPSGSFSITSIERASLVLESRSLGTAFTVRGSVVQPEERELK
jgi:hypothetical protein